MGKTFSHSSSFSSKMNGWLIFGLFGQLMFSMRFIVQWIVSEKRKESVVPIQFWYYSLAGSLTLLLYAIHRKDPVFILGQSLGTFIYIRNLILIYRKQAEISKSIP
ncbi:MAG TPA: lipid-A-disaccharide synthase N-terminal domain-containing protein [Candidatus Limnocylindrales bacterium]|nr:lipid-A-disaccharide synthase N-terminal domain-containing protein [Candidatus Limnocylindrales bacterium]